MTMSSSFFFLLVFVAVVCLPAPTVAFGAGNIPSFAYMEGRAFRHGDIEDALAELAKQAGGFALGSLIGKGGSKFGGLDIKRVYFGNWLRDYSQAVDIASLKKLPLQTVINLCMVLGFMAHGYATHEFEVTEERLGVYLPTEHIDNPKGYGAGEDPRKYHPKLRGPVDPRELEVDPRTGMKNYIANENGSWDTSKALVRRTLERCIHLGRQHRAQNQKQDLYEAYRLLGQALHTLEDFSAHSNFCELSLVSLGHSDVFLHVGDQVRLKAPNGKWVAPIVTGTFGGSDFIHSLLGEAGDHLSEASVSDLNKELDKARSSSTRSGGSNPSDVLRTLFFSIPGGGGSEMSREMEGIERIRAGPQQGGKRPEDMSPQELHAVLWQVLTFRDSVVKKIEKTIEKIPGLGSLIEKIMESISVFVFTTLEPFLKPILKSSTAGLQSVAGEVIDNQDQYEVFNDPRASDPTHSFLSKDHFNLILNEPAGQLAKIILIHTVGLVTKAWDDTSINVHQLAEDATSCMFHPDFHNSNSKIQREMLQCMRDWVQKMGGKQRELLQRLSKNAVRNHENIRRANEGGPPAVQGSYAQTQGVQMQHNIQGYLNQIPGVSQASSVISGFSGGQGQGQGRDAPQPGYPGANHGHNPPSSNHGPSHYGESHGHGGSGPSFPGSNSSYGPPSGPPPQSYGGAPSFPGSPGQGYGPPSGPPPGGHAFPDAQPQHGGYNPSYSSPPPSFPGAPPSFPGGPGEYGNNHGGYAPPSGPPPGGFPDPNNGGGFGMPGGPSFPNQDPYHSHQNAPQFPGGPSYPQPGNQYPY
ncbi:heterokaryon incompatibility protein HET-C [Mycena floridula]|nr:heterokaryon incompatibility protein HET-C [Mycena floridula]